MPLPPTRYALVTDVARDWETEVFQLFAYATEEQLSICVMTIGLRIETGQFETVDDEPIRVPTGRELLHGPHEVYGTDLWPVLREGSAPLTRLRPVSPDTYREIDEDHPLKVTQRDLVIMREERERFEAQHGLGAAASSPPRLNTAHDAFVHDENYARVSLHGRILHLGPRQAAVMRLLHAAAGTDCPWIDGEFLLTKAGSGSMRLVDLFKTQNHWRELILSDRKGRWRLNLPSHDMPRIRSYRRAHLRLVVG